MVILDGFETELGGPQTVPLAGPGNFYVWSAAVLESSQGEQELSFEENYDPEPQLDTIYIGTFGGLFGEGKVLKSTDGFTFEYVTDDAFGADNIYGMRSMEIVGDSLYVGGSSSALYPSTDLFG